MAGWALRAEGAKVRQCDPQRTHEEKRKKQRAVPPGAGRSMQPAPSNKAQAGLCRTPARCLEARMQAAGERQWVSGRGQSGGCGGTHCDMGRFF